MKLKYTFLLVLLSITFYSCKETPSDNQNDEDSFYETQMSIKIDSANIKGTLLMPDSMNNYPLVIIVAGSGPTDRDGNNPLGVNAQTYKLLSESMLKKGIASFRYDKRGIAESSMSNLKEQDLLFETYINDLVEIVNYFNKDVRFSKIIILGHSEGALIGAAACNISTPDKFISVAGTEKPADSILFDQLNSQGLYNMTEVAEILSGIKNGKIMPVFDQNLAQIFRPSVQPYMTSWFKYNPVEVYSKINIPVLVLHGTTDIQIPVENANLLDNALPKSNLVILDNMNHILKDAVAGDTTANLETYKNANLPVNEILISEIADFVKN